MSRVDPGNPPRTGLLSRLNREGNDLIGASAAIASISAVGIAIGLSFPLLSFILENRGYSAVVIGANAAMAGLAAMAAVWLVDPMVKRFGVVTTMVIGAVVAAFSLIGFYVFDALWAWFLLRVTFHGSLTLSFVMSEFWINSAAAEKQRGLMLGVYATVLSAGFGIGPGILAVTGSQGSLPFIIGFAVIMLSTLPVMWAKTREPVVGKEKAAKGGFFPFVWAVPLATAAVLVFGAVEQSALPLFPVYGQGLGFSEAKTSLLLVIVAAGNVAFQIPLGILSDRVSDRRLVLYFCAVVGAVGALLLPVALQHSIWLVYAILFLWGGVVSGMYTVGLAHLGSRLKGADLALANAAFVFCYTVGMTVGPQLSGIAMEWDIHGLPYAIASYFVLYLVLCIYRGIRRQ